MSIKLSSVQFSSVAAELEESGRHQYLVSVIGVIISPGHSNNKFSVKNGFHRSVVTARQNTVPSVPSVPSVSSVPYVLGNGRFLRNGRNGRYVRMETRH